MQTRVQTSNSLSLALVTKRELGRYTLLAKLATGGMADIFLARQRGAQGFEKLVVVKRILSNYAADPDFVAMFLDEGRLAGQLSHPNIVQTFDLGEDGGDYFIAMEYVAGESLAQLARTARLKGRPIDDRFAARLISQAAAGLDRAHRQTDVLGKPLNIVHRDISPQNLLVTYEGQRRWWDFGIAKAANRASHTGQGQVKGKLSYMSPEQLHGDGVDGRSDLFSLGVVLFELVTGSRFAEGGDAARAVAMIAGRDPLPTAQSRRADIDPRLDALITKAMDRDANKRCQTGNELHVELEGWLSTRPPLNPSDAAAFMQEALRGAHCPAARADREGAHRRSGDSQRGRRRGCQERSVDARRQRAHHRQGGRRGEAGPAPAGAGADRHGAHGAHRRRTLVDAPRRDRRADRQRAAAHRLASEGVVYTVPLTPAAYGRGCTAGHHAGSHGGRRQPAEHHAAYDGWREPAGTTTSPTTATAPATVTPPAIATTRPAAITTKPIAKTTSTSAPEHSRPARGKPGKLSIDTQPWTEVFWHGKDLGQTPLIEVDLPAGTQALQLKNADDKIDQAIEVEIRAGAVTAKRLRLR